MKDFEYNGHSFSHIASIALRLYSIPPSEAGAERSFSKLKWRFPDRRNRTKHDKMLNEIHIEHYHYQKIDNSNEQKDDSNKMKQSDQKDDNSNDKKDDSVKMKFIVLIIVRASPCV